MSSKSWLVLLVMAAGCCLWFLSLSSYELWSYWRLSGHAPAEIRTWRVKELSASKFSLSASYFYEVEGIRYEGKDDLEEPLYLNRFSAEEDLKKFRQTKWSVWYSKSHPEISALQKFFPFKHLIYTFLTAGILVFFLYQRLNIRKEE